MPSIDSVLDEQILHLIDSFQRHRIENIVGNDYNFLNRTVTGFQTWFLIDSKEVLSVFADVFQVILHILNFPISATWSFNSYVE